MVRSYNEDILALEDLLERFASEGYTLDEVYDLFENALEEIELFDEEFEDEDEY